MKRPRTFDIDAAKREIMACRRVKDKAWRYSLAFLLAYEGNMRRAREEYYEAFQGRIRDVTLPVQCEEFIQLVLEKEPDRVQLLFCTAQINQFAKGDSAAARRDYEAFLAALAPGQFIEEAEIARRELAQLASEPGNSGRLLSPGR